MRQRARPISFMALGGGRTIGNSCYALELGGSVVLLDCGASRRGAGMLLPDFEAWREARQAAGASDGAVDQLFLSHAHLDHARLVPSFAALHPETTICMTALTRALLPVSSDLPEERVQVVSYGKAMRFPGYEASFWPAGHIPGAMMTLFTYGGRRILYTGDYSCVRTPLADACCLPDGPIDVLILCAVHACHPYRAVSEGLFAIYADVRDALARGRSVYVKCVQRSKGVELLRYLRSSDLLQHVPIYLDRHMMATVHALEALGIPVLTAQDYPLAALQGGRQVVVLAGEAPGFGYAGFTRIEGDQFALHDDFAQTAAFLRRVDPALAVIVHCTPPQDEETVESVLLRDGGCRTQFLFPADGTMYEI